jgi:8-oxo-dGTP pyrophosphatase MutT (NUDIX family)
MVYALAHTQIMSQDAGMNRDQQAEYDTGARIDAGATRALVHAYQPVDVVSAEYQRQFLDLLDRRPHDFANRYNYHAGVPGHFTAQAVIFNPDLKAVALMHHRKLDIWVGPGGHIDHGDGSAEVAARREAVEEMGLRDLFLAQASPFDLDIHGFPAKGPQPDHLHYDIRFLFTTPQRDFAPNDESTEVAWVPLADLDQYMPHWLSNTRLKQGLRDRFGPA